MSERLAQFIELTGSTADEARKFLEISEGDVESAVLFYFDAQEAGEIESPPPAQTESTGAPQHSYEPYPGSRSTGATTNGSTGATKKFKTFKDLADEDQSDDPDKDQTYYAGGGEKSGQLVQDPKKKKDPRFQHVDPLIDMATRQQQHPSAGMSKSLIDARAAKSYFSAQSHGHTLGGPSSKSEHHHKHRHEQPNEYEHAQPGAAQVDITLEFFKNGFTVDNGPLRDYTAAENTAFLNQATAGDVPLELVKNHRPGTQFNIRIQDRRGEDYVPTKKPVAAFSGQGNMLGSPVPQIKSQPASENKPAASSSSIRLDPDLSVTSIHVRTMDGQRLVISLNGSHTAQDLYKEVATKTQLLLGGFVLRTGFPPKVLAQTSESIDSLCLANTCLTMSKAD